MLDQCDFCDKLALVLVLVRVVMAVYIPTTALSAMFQCAQQLSYIRYSAYRMLHCVDARSALHALCVVHKAHH